MRSVYMSIYFVMKIIVFHFAEFSVLHVNNAMTKLKNNSNNTTTVGLKELKQ